MNLSLPFKILQITGSTTLLMKHTLSTQNKCGMFFCRHGFTEISLDGKTFNIKRGDVFLFMPSMFAHLSASSEDADGYLVEVDLSYILPIINKVSSVEYLLKLREQPCVELSDSQYAYLERLIEQLLKRMQSVAHDNLTKPIKQLMQELIKSMGQSLCYELLNIYFIDRELVLTLHGKKDEVFKNFLIALLQNYKQEREVAYYANLQCITPRYFSTIIKERTGLTALQWIVQMVTTEAKFLLKDSNYSIKEIADQLNFPNQSFFGKYFKQYTGKSPKEFRKQFDE